MRIAMAVVFLLSFLAVPLLAQDPELTMRDAASTDALLRSSCYCINCGPAEVDQLVAARCRFVRWGGYPFVSPNRLTDPANYQERHDTVFRNFRAFVQAYKNATRQDNVVEFAIPEIVTAGVEQIVLGDTHPALAALNIIPNLPASYRFKFAEVRVLKFGDYYWRDDPANYEKSGVPSLMTENAPGRLWAAYLALRAIREGADAIYFAQPHIRVDDSDELEKMVRTIRKLRGAAQPPLLFGASATDSVRKGTSRLPLRNFIDYAKVKVDIDSYTMFNGVRTVRRDTGERVPCELLATKSGNNTFLPTDHPELQYMCMIATNQPDRRVATNSPGRTSSFDDSNPYMIRMLMELDGSQKCEWGGQRVWYYLPDGALTSTCYQQVRHGLPTTMWFLSRSYQARAAFIQYMYRLARKLTDTKNVGVYFPLPVKVDQNEMKFVLQQQDCAAVCSTACEGKPFLRPTQVAKIPGCPGPGTPGGRFCAVAKEQYFARDCLPDMDTLKTVLPPLPVP